MNNNNVRIVIDAGHGGKDPGTIANGIIEKDYTLKISKYMKKRFDELGIQSALTRDSDETLDADKRPARVQSFFGNGKNVIVISNHINAGGGDGAEIIYALRNSSGLSNKIATEIVNSGQNVRKFYQRRLPSNPSKDYYYILRDTPNNETIIVEYGFADSTGDDVSQIKNNWENLAEAVVKAVANYAGVPYKPVVKGDFYIVKSGDTLWKIANNYGTTVAELKALNNLTSNSLSIGQYLKIPSLITEDNVYTVKSGDTLWGIAKKNNITVDELKKINNLTSNTLSIGQKLKLKPNTEELYVVKSGDTLYKIASQYNTTVNELKRINNLTSNLLSKGQKLKVS